MERRRASRNFEEIGPELCRYLTAQVPSRLSKDHRQTYKIDFQYATEHRCGVRIRGPNLCDKITGTDPLVDGRPLIRCRPRAELMSKEELQRAENTSALVNSVSDAVCALLEEHEINQQRRADGRPLINGVLFRGCGMRLECPEFRETQAGLFSEESAEPAAVAIAPTCIISGLLQTIGIKILSRNEFKQLARATGGIDTDLQAKAETILQYALEKRPEFAFVHVKAVDDAGHDRDLDCKKRLLEATDRMVKTLVNGLLAKDFDLARRTVIAVLGDHSTLAGVTGDHSFEPVPVLICALKSFLNLARETGCTIADSKVARYSELDAARGILGRFRGLDFMRILTAYKNQVLSEESAGGNGLDPVDSPLPNSLAGRVDEGVVLIFAYGTLQSERVWERVMYPIRGVYATGRMPGVLRGYRRFLVRNNQYPGIVPCIQEPQETVEGTVIELRGSESALKEAMACLDRYEGVEIGLYRRVLLRVWCANAVRECFVYVFSRPELITNTSWSLDDFLSNRQQQHLHEENLN